MFLVIHAFCSESNTNILLKSINSHNLPGYQLYINRIIRSPVPLLVVPIDFY